MDIDKKMAQVVREVVSGADTDPDRNLVDSLKFAIRHWGLEKSEIRYLCRRFSVLTEDLEN